jgi:uncharacterized protein (DUF433 family)
MVRESEAAGNRLCSPGKTMTETDTLQPTIIRTGRGLTIAGTRTTLYLVMDYITADWSPSQIQECLRLSDRQLADVLEYIEAHREEVEAEYQLVLRQAEEHRQYWEERNRERLAQIAAMPPEPGQEAIRAKLDAWKAKLAQA